MAEFLSGAWFAERNAALAARGPTGLAATLRVALVLSDAPSGGPGALTLVLAPEGGRLEPGDPGVCELVVTLAASDAAALVEGRLTSSGALRAGQLSVRGNAAALVPVTAWLAGEA
ncbi:MAG: SCP2 sterol-binding domain-containing protein [Acidimicrobiales bacterium]